MKTWIKSVWVKRLVPLVLLAAIWGGYQWQKKSRIESLQAEADRIGQVFAEVWVASATYRDKPEKFIAYRDSLLKAKGITREEIEEYIKAHQDETEIYYDFTRTVSDKVDSMYRIKDSVLKAQSKDSTVVAKNPKDSTPRIRKRMGSVPIYPEQK
jgi:hypothetical protein